MKRTAANGLKNYPICCWNSTFLTKYAHAKLPSIENGPTTLAWPMTLTFNPLRAMVIAYPHVKVQGQWPVGSEDKVETIRQTEVSALPPILNAVGKHYAVHLPFLWAAAMSLPQEQILSTSITDFKQHVRMSDEVTIQLLQNTAQLITWAWMPWTGQTTPDDIQLHTGFKNPVFQKSPAQWVLLGFSEKPIFLKSPARWVFNFMKIRTEFNNVLKCILFS